MCGAGPVTFGKLKGSIIAKATKNCLAFIARPMKSSELACGAHLRFFGCSELQLRLGQHPFNTCPGKWLTGHLARTTAAAQVALGTAPPEPGSAAHCALNTGQRCQWSWTQHPSIPAQSARLCQHEYPIGQLLSTMGCITRQSCQALNFVCGIESVFPLQGNRQRWGSAGHCSKD